MDKLPVGLDTIGETSSKLVEKPVIGLNRDVSHGNSSCKIGDDSQNEMSGDNVNGAEKSIGSIGPRDKMIGSQEKPRDRAFVNATALEVTGKHLISPSEIVRMIYDQFNQYIFVISFQFCRKRKNVAMSSIISSPAIIPTVTLTLFPHKKQIVKTKWLSKCQRFLLGKN